MNNITIIGTGYVGLVTGVGLAMQKDNHVICVDNNEEKIKKLNDGIAPIYEKGIQEQLDILLSNKSIEFTDDLKDAVGRSIYIFIAVGTPQKDNGACDLEYVYSVCDELIDIFNSYTTATSRVVVMKSTVPPGTCSIIQKRFNETLFGKGHQIYVVSNPEFLKEGVALDDFLNPDRIVIGSSFKLSNTFVASCYGDIALSHPVVYCNNTQTAEMIKYASNAMLATRISFMNEIASIGRQLDVDIDKVSEGVGMDFRIGKAFLKPGIGYGGSCFPKDVAAMKNIGHTLDVETPVLDGVMKTNDIAKMVPFNFLQSFFWGNLVNRTIAIWGLSFKPETDDIREASALTLIKKLFEYLPLRINVYDPKATKNFEKWLEPYAFTKDYVHICKDKYECLEHADVLIICTEWKEFEEADFVEIKTRMHRSCVIDGRNIFLSRIKKSGNPFEVYFHI